MGDIIGIDSRSFIRRVTKSDGTKGEFVSVLGIAVKVSNYASFRESYQKAMDHAFKKVNLDQNYQYYCVNDLKDFKDKDKLLDHFIKKISPFIQKVHVVYTLFSKKRFKEAKVYGRMAKQKKIRLSTPTRTYEKLVSSHLTQCFPAICAWRLLNYFYTDSVEFHLDAYQGHAFEAQEELEEFEHIVYPSGDCVNPIISTADLLLDVLDRRLLQEKKFLIFDSIRPALKEFGNNVLVYPITNKHLPKITPLEKKRIDVLVRICHPVFWVFKGEPLLDSGTFRRSQVYRNLLDYAANLGGTVKMFERGRDIEYFKEGDFGVFLNSKGKEIIESYTKLGKSFSLFNLNIMVPNVTTKK